MSKLDDDLRKINIAWYFCDHAVKLGAYCAPCSLRCMREQEAKNDAKTEKGEE